MARLHTRKKGKAGSRKPKKFAPKWIDFSPQEIEKTIVELRRAGSSIAEIGKTLRDQYGIPDVKSICKKTITQIVEEQLGKLAYKEDILNLMKRAVGLRKHLEKHKGDVHNIIKLRNVESKIRRLGRYYTKKKMLPPNWTYVPEQAALLVK